MELHLDLVGGMAGDMFVAALLDAFPHYEARVLDNVAAVSTAVPLVCSVVRHTDRILCGRRFEVRSALDAKRHGAGFPLLGGEALTHAHTNWKTLRHDLETSPLDPSVRLHAIALFELLADAEAFVHGVARDQVTFHEVGAWDSIADIVAAAVLIHETAAVRWTASPVPLGSGRVNTAHGIMPVPAPATARLLLGMPTFDDGIAGERVTPTGAAILRYLCHPSANSQRLAHSTRTLLASGVGFGSRVLAGISNHVRVLCFETSAEGLGGHRQIEVLEFEVDDQSAEDLAAGVERLRRHAAVLDVTQSPVFGKKGRMMTHVRVLARRAGLEQVVEACFRETTTIGLRHSSVEGIGLKRALAEVEVEGHRLRVKVVDRPGGKTAKAESDDVSGEEGQARRARLRGGAERAALECSGPDA